MDTLIELDRDASPAVLAGLLGANAQVAQGIDGRWWLRIRNADTATLTRLQSVPGRRMIDRGDQWLVRPGEKIASARVDADCEWKRLEDVLRIEMPTAWMAGRLSESTKTDLRLRRGGEPTTPSAAIITSEQLGRWAESASEVRLRRLRWLVDDRQALVLGDPLPSVEARLMVSDQRVLVPAGMSWFPQVSAAQVRSLFGVRADQWIVWEHDRCSVVDDDQFHSMRRSAIRAWSRHVPEGDVDS